MKKPTLKSVRAEAKREKEPAKKELAEKRSKRGDTDDQRQAFGKKK